MRVIYLDVLAAVNLAMDYVILLATARLAGEYCSRGRILAGASIGAVYAALSVLPGLSAMATLPVQAVAGAAMVRAVFGKREYAVLARLVFLFWLVSFAFAGGALALGRVSDAWFFAGGGYYIDVPFRVVALAAAVCWVLTGLIFRGQFGHGGVRRTTETVTMAFAGQRQAFELLVDSGNDLSDPASGRPVLVLDRKAAARLLPPEVAVPLTRLGEDNAAQMMTELPARWRGRFRLIPYRALGRENGLLLAFRPDKALRSGKTWDGLAAVSPGQIAEGRYEGLIGL